MRSGYPQKHNWGHSRRFHPRWYRERMPIFWWLEKPSYVGFIARELTSLGVAYTALLFVVQLAALARGEEAARRFAALLASPLAIAAHTLLLAILLCHTLTWLHLAPKAMVVKLAGRRLPDGVVLASHYVGWIAASTAVVYLLLGG